MLSFLKGRTKIVFFIGLLSCISAYLIQPQQYFIKTSISFDLFSTVDGAMQIFYSSNDAFSEENSIFINVKNTKSFETYSATLQAKNINLLRIDPAGDFKIRSITLQSAFGSYHYDAKALTSKIEPSNKINIVYSKNNTVDGVILGEDPQFVLLDIPIINPISKNIIYLIYFFSIILIFILYLGFFKVYTKYRNSIVTSNEVDIPISKNLFLIIIFAIFSWYIFQLFFFAVKIGPGISPDEVYHLGVSKLYSDFSVFFIADTPNTYQYGPISTAPYLYHLLMGKLLLFNFFNLTPLLFLRLINILISIFSVYVTLLFVKEFTKNVWIQIIVILVQTNILMFVFISSMISYDTLINLVSVLSFLFLIRFLKSYSRTYLLLLFITMAIGPLIKITYAPLVLIQILILLVHFKELLLNREKFLTKRISKIEICLLIFCLFFIILNFKLYGGNILNYHQILPTADKVFGHSIAYKYYDQYVRDYNFQTSVTLRQLMPFSNFLIKYLFRTQETIFGIMGHINMRRDQSDMLIYLVLLALGLIVILLNRRSVFTNSLQNILLFSSVAYISIIFYVNYSAYIQYKIFGLALQGRYNFPVLVLIIVYIAYNSLFRLNDNIKIVILLILTPLLIYNCFFWFLTHCTPGWFI